MSVFISILLLSFTGFILASPKGNPPGHVDCKAPHTVYDHNPPSPDAEKCKNYGCKDTDKTKYSPRCVCEKKFCRNDSDVCVPAPGTPCYGDRNATYSDCVEVPQPSCDNLHPVVKDPCDPCEPGCKCNKGFIYSEYYEKCIDPKDCMSCNGDPNAKYVKCAPVCEPTCQEPDCDSEPCLEPCTSGCVCKEGYIRLTKNGKCVKMGQCPPGCNGDKNATAVPCPDPCPSTCDVPNAAHYNCKIPCRKVGCQCNTGYLQNANGQCILPKDCPCGDPCGPNGHFSNCRTYFETDYCPDHDGPPSEPGTPADPCYNPGCMCNKCYLRKNKTDDQCIPMKDCAPIKCTEPHTVYDSTPPHPDAEKCGSSSGGDSKCHYPRCVCEKGYCRNGTNDCVPAPGTPCYGDCNATYYDCVEVPQPSCDNLHPVIKDPCPCEPGCKCNDGYIYSEEYKKCIDPHDCTSCNGDPNAKYVKCAPVCEPTCQEPDCDSEPCLEPCTSGCVCKEGYIRLTKNGKCVKVEHCPSGCNGDNNATTVYCPDPCPSTCENPNAPHHRCFVPCKKIGCQCNTGYLEDENGKCILPKDCPCGDPCGPNGHFSNCRTECDSDYCPSPDNSHPEPCTPPEPCYNPGCMCNPCYVRRNRTDDQCIPMKECPPIKCSGPHTVCNTNPPHPDTDKCGNSGSSTDNSKCYPPRCTCEKGYCRNGSDVCVPAPGTPCYGDCNATYSDCVEVPQPSCNNLHPVVKDPCDPCEPGCKCNKGYIYSEYYEMCISPYDCKSCNGDENAVYTECMPDCEPTCAEPECYGDSTTKPCVSGCICKYGYIRSSETGKCIEVSKCPPGCHGDGNATAVICPNMCPSTCARPNAMQCRIPCKPLGCNCNSGYMREGPNWDEGKCILPKDCPGGDPCAPYGHFVDCRSDCEKDYCPVDESSPHKPCEKPIRCYSGCNCFENHKYTWGNEGLKCIPICDCPAFNCTAPNTEYNCCPTRCDLLTCDDIQNPPQDCTCDGPCVPQCVCKKDYYKDANGNCVCKSECPC